MDDITLRYIITERRATKLTKTASLEWFLIKVKMLFEKASKQILKSRN